MRAPIEKPGIKFPTKPLPNLGDTISKAVDNLQHAKLDTNHDGQLNRDEFDAGNSPLQNAISGSADAKFDRYDKDNDGYVSKDEYHAGKQAERASHLHLPPICKPLPIHKEPGGELPVGPIIGSTPDGQQIH